MPRTRTRSSRVYWKNGRAYADYRDFRPWGGGLEALKAEGARAATTDADEATILSAARLQDLQELRRKHPNGLNAQDDDPKARFATFAGYHLAAVEGAEEDDRRAPSAGHMDRMRGQLTAWAGYFASVGVVRLDEITAQHIRDFMKVLKERGVPPELMRERVGGRRGPLNRTTRRRYFDALARCLHRATVERYISANPANEILEKPTAAPSPTPFLEVPEAALLIEACRRYVAGGQGFPFLAELVACLLLTGGRVGEVKGLAIADVDFTRGIVHIRPNVFRPRLKNEKTARRVPLWPQLREILSAYLAGPHAPPAGGLLFPLPGSGGRATLGDWRKSLDGAAALAGWKPQALRPRMFRQTYATARLQTVDNGEPVSLWTVRGEMGHTTTAMLERVYGRLGDVRQRRPHVEYRWEEWEPTMGHRLLGVELVGLTPAQRDTLEAVFPHPKGLCMRDWGAVTGRNPGSLFPQRDRLAVLGLVEKEGQGKGARWKLTHSARLALAGTARTPEVQHGPPEDRRAA
jgi:integrase